MRVDELYLMFRVPVCLLGKDKACASHLLPEHCVCEFQMCFGCCFGTSVCLGIPTGCEDEQAERDSSGVG